MNIKFEKESVLFLLIGIGLLSAGALPNILGITIDAVAGSALCETCFDGIGNLYLSGFMVLGSLFIAFFFLSHFFKIDFSFLSPKSKKGIFFWFLIIGLLFLLQAVFSVETVTEDTYSHFLNSLEGWNQPILLLDVFHKPLFAMIGALVAPFGFTAYLTLFALMSAVTIGIIYLSAKELGIKDDWFAMLLAGFSPVFFLGSGSGLAAAPLLMFSAIAYYFYLKEKFVVSSFFISLLPFIRSEGFLFMGLWFLLLLWKKQYKAIPVLFSVTFLIWIIGAIVKGNLLWHILEHPNIAFGDTYTGWRYGNGPITHYFERFFIILGAAGAILFQLGLVLKAKAEKYWPVFGMFFLFFFFHVYNYSFASFGSYGQIHYMYSIAPLGALIAAAALNSFLNPKKELGKKSLLFAGLFFVESAFLFLAMDNFIDKSLTLMFALTAVLFVLIVANDYLKDFSSKFFARQTRDFFIIAFLVLITIGSAFVFAHPPRGLNYEHSTAIEISSWLKSEGYSDRVLFSTMGFLHVFSENEPFGGGIECYFDCMYTSFKSYASAEPETIVVWDPHYSPQFASVEEIENSGYTILKKFPIKNSPGREFVVLEKSEIKKI